MIRRRLTSNLVYKQSLLGLVLALSFVLVSPIPTQAVSGSDWRAGRIIDDSVFNNKNTMNVGDIQNFLNSKVPVCDTNGTGFYNGVRRSQVSSNNPPPFICLRDYQENVTTHENNLGGTVPAGAISGAQIIYDAAQTHNINPQVLLVMLQKEQSLITDDWPWRVQYRSAMGYGCPDTAPCDSEYYGFYNQVNNAAAQFNRYANNPNSFRHKVLQNNNVLYNPQSVCGSSSVFIETQATAGLYNYTPYQPNTAALNNLYGIGDACSAYGNRNFWRMYNDWFGLPTGSNVSRIISDDGSPTQYVVYGGIKQAIPSLQILTAWNLQNQPLVTASSSYVSSLPTGPNLDRIYTVQGSNAQFFMDNGKHYYIGSGQLKQAWNIQNLAISSVPVSLANLSTDGGNLSYSVKSAGSSTIYMMDGVNGSSEEILRPYASTNVIKAWEGDIPTVVTLSDDFFDTIDNAVGSSLTSTRISYGGAEYQVISGQRIPQSANIGSLFGGSAQAVNVATFNRLYANSTNATQFIRSVNSPFVYLVDGGTKHHVTSGDILAAWSNGRSTIVVNDGYVDLLPTGSPVSGYLADVGGQLYMMDGNKYTIPSGNDSGYRTNSNILSASSALMNEYSNITNATNFIRGRNSPTVYLMDAGTKRPIPSHQMFTLLNGTRNEAVMVLNDRVLSQFSTGSTMKEYFSVSGTNYIFDNGTYSSVSGSSATAWNLSGPTSIASATLGRFTNSGQALGDRVQAGDYRYYIANQRRYYTTNSSLASVWEASSGTPVSFYFVNTLTIDGGPLSQFVKSSDAGDSRLFLKDTTTLFTLGNPSQAQTLGIVGLNIVTMPSSTISGMTITNAKNLVANSANRYVVDNGTKRSFADTTTRNRWAPNGDSDYITISNSLNELMPTGSSVYSAIKGSGDRIYGLDNGQRRWLSPNAFTTVYGSTYSGVSDFLLNSIPEGSVYN